MSISLKPLSKDLIADYLYFFDHIKFTENPDWEKCYCYSYHFTGKKEEWSRDNNRQAVQELIAKGEMKGFLAYADNKVVGWCNANDNHNYQALSEKDSSNEKVCSIVCFLIHPDFRRKGIARMLLEQVIKDYHKLNYNYIEAYPRKASHSCEKNYHGHLKMYEAFGFKVAKEYEDRYVVRKEI